MKSKIPNAEQLNMKNTSFQSMMDVLSELGISETDVRVLMKSNERKKCLAQHHHEIWQNRRGRWVTYVSDSTHTNHRRQLSANTKAGLEDKLVEYYQQDISSRTLTLRILYPDWIATKIQDVKPQTVVRIKKDWNRYYENSDLVDIPLTELSTKYLNTWTKSMINDYSMGRHQFGNFSLIIRQMFAYALEENYISENPYSKVKVKWGNLHSERRKPESKLVFKKHEQSIFIDYCWSEYRKKKLTVQRFVPLAIVFAFYTGLRCGELAAIKFEDIDGSVMKVQRMVEYENRRVVPWLKEEDSRFVPLIPEAEDLIEEVRKARLELGLPVDSYIFAVNHPLNTYTQVQKMVRNYCVRLGMVPRSPHDIRRTYISNLIDDKVDLTTVMSVAGHRQASTTMNSYAFSVREARERAVAIRKAVTC